MTRVGADAEGDRQKVFGRKPEDRPPVRTDVADRFQFERQAFGGVERGQQNDVVHLADFSVLLVDATDLTRKDKARRYSEFAHVGKARLFFDAVKALFGRFERLRKFFPPGGMREVAGADERYALAARPEVEVRDIGIPARGPRIFGMNV